MAMGVAGVPVFQSPPYRGTTCDSDRAFPRTPAPSDSFQSPPYRGTTCDLRAIQQAAEVIDFQSPPYRGTTCDRRRRPRSSCGARAFSPLLIGEQPATEQEALRDASMKILSVPSLSGNNLRLARWGTMPDVRRAFQSPPYRGTTCDSFRLPPEAADLASFSLLLIGEQPATTQKLYAGLHVTAVAFQSPPYRGTTCDSRRRAWTP